MTESANGTTITPSIITDNAANVWGLAPSQTKGSQIVRNGAILTSTSNAALLLYYNHTVYHQNTSNNWYYYRNGSWIAASDPRLIESPDGTTVTTIGPAIVNSFLEAWTLVNSGTASGVQIACNGVTDTITSSVTTLLYYNHLVYQQNTAGNWYFKSRNSDAWSPPTTDPRVPPVTPTGPTAPAAPTITGITLSNNTFTGGSPAGTVVGTIKVAMDTGTFSGTLSLSGTNASFFQIAGNNLITVGVVPIGPYTINIIATQAGATGSPFTQQFAIRGLQPATPTGPTAPTGPTGPIAIKAPPQASAAGYSNLVFSDDFTSASSIAPTGTAASGYKWYWGFSVGQWITSNSWAVNTGQAAGSGASSSGGILTLNSVRASNQSFWGNSTLTTLPARAITNGQVPAGTAWQHGYFEGYMQMVPAGSARTQANGWPAFWAWSAEGAGSFGFGSQTGLNSPASEIDFMEATGNIQWPNGGVDPYGKDIANVFNPGGVTLAYNVSFPTLDSNWHTWGCLWKPGTIQFFYDNVAIGSPKSTSGWALENTHIFLILGTGISWPVNVDWVRVWQ